MSDVAVLVLVLCVFYLHDCSLWIERDTVVFLARGARRWRPMFPHRLLSGGRKGLLLSLRLPPLAPVYLAFPSRIALSPTHVAPILPPLEPSVGSAGDAVRPAVPWSAIHTVDVVEVTVRVNGEGVGVCQTQDRATATAALLRDLVQRCPADRKP
jgi:hypothetical protein